MSEITALVRNAAKLPLFASIGVKTLFGSLDDATLIERQASKSDVVFACVSLCSSKHVSCRQCVDDGCKWP